ncbi:hypothetical protein GN958_ATG17729 [Phytophthora infestans]|uniref:Uncharacterized protein n=1 Tax=Phytophthora infestans TaxID=4787 RepID=A0A8S9TWF5_PHYIN|nr:hypothetical protein GN958_ATG17729 [Phytophthora infestans]
MKSELVKRFAPAKPPEFPLANRHDDLKHVLSVLKQIGEIKRICQAERPMQVEVLVKLVLARIEDLNPDHALPHYTSTDENPRWIAASDLTPLAAKTRLLLREALDQRFFSRYYNDTKLAKCAFIMEMQLKLHPIYKHTERSLDHQRGDQLQTIVIDVQKRNWIGGWKIMLMLNVQVTARLEKQFSNFGKDLSTKEPNKSKSRKSAVRNSIVFV